MITPIASLRLSAAQVEGLSDASLSHIRNIQADAGFNIEQVGAVRRFSYSIGNLFDLVAYQRRNNRLPRSVAPIPRTVAAVFNGKGGVGKTTTTAELAIHLQALGNEVLVIDADKQGSLSVLFGYEPELTHEWIKEYSQEKEAEAKQEPDPIKREELLSELRESVQIMEEQVVKYHVAHLLNLPHCFGYKCYDENGDLAYADLPNIVRKPFGENGPHLLPSELSLESVEEALQSAPFREAQLFNLFSKGFNEPNSHIDLSRYNIILIDCHPGLSYWTRNILFAADIVISPFGLSRLDCKGTSYFSRCMARIKADYNHIPPVIVVPFRYQPQRKRSNSVLNLVRRSYASVMSQTMISDSEEMARSQTEGISTDHRRSTKADAAKDDDWGRSFCVPYSLVNPLGKVPKQYHQLALEVCELARKAATTRPRRYGEYKPVLDSDSASLEPHSLEG